MAEVNCCRVCGVPMERRRNNYGYLETPESYAQRKVCSPECRAEHNARLARESRQQRGDGPIGSGGATPYSRALEELARSKPSPSEYRARRAAIDKEFGRE